MLVYDTKLVEHLKTLGLPVYYEQIVDNTVKTPCITYEPMDNSSYLEGDTLFYSNIEYYIRIWGHTKAELVPYLEQVSNLMRDLGFRRNSYVELRSDTYICLVLLFKGTGYEKEM